VRALLQDLVRTLHSYVLRNDLTESEWLYAINFLTRTGQITDENARSSSCCPTRWACPVWSIC